MIALIIILAALLIIVGVILIVSLKKKAEIQQKNTKLNSDNKNLQSMNSILEANNKDLINQLGSIPVTIKDEVVAHKVLEEKIAELTVKAKALELDEQQRKDAIQQLDLMAQQLTEQNTSLKEEHNHLLQSVRDARKIISDIENNELGAKLPHADEGETNLVLLLENIANQYNYIAEDIRSISWKRVWLPKIQKLVKDCQADGVIGVYKITIKKGDNLYNYIGKATDVKNRWYQHLGKMCGKESSGGEFIYKNVTVKDLLDDNVDIYFSILEKVDDPAYLDETEHRWIATLGDLNIKS